MMMMVIALITFNSSLVPLIEGFKSMGILVLRFSPHFIANPWEFEFSGLRQNRADDLKIKSPSL